MELIALVLSSLSFVGFVVAAVLLRGYLPSYLAEKGKNLASKEDLAHLTDLVEGVKALHTSELERLKADLLTEGQITERRRRVYEEMCIALRGAWRNTGDERTLSRRLRCRMVVGLGQRACCTKSFHRAADPASVDQPTMKSGYTAIVVEMRKDVGFGGTVASGSDYQFVQF